MSRRPGFAQSAAAIGNAAIAAVTVLALCSGAWLLRNGAETHAPPQPSAAQARAGQEAGRQEDRAERSAGPASGLPHPHCRPPRPTASASPRSA